jgi:hypothetical protein
MRTQLVVVATTKRQLCAVSKESQLTMSSQSDDHPPSETGGQEAKDAASESIQQEETKQEETKQAQVRGPLPLDWTRVTAKKTTKDDDDDDEEENLPIRYPWDVTEIDINDESDLVIVGTAGQKITRMGIDLDQKVNANIKQLILRSHLIRTMEGIGGFTQLELLELYDNMVNSLTALNEGPNGAPGCTLLVLDMSYNAIRDMTPVSYCPNLKELCKLKLE